MRTGLPDSNRLSSFLLESIFSRRRFFIFGFAVSRERASPPRPRRSERERVSAHARDSPPRPPTVNPVEPTFQTRRVSGVLAMIQEAETGRRVPPAEMETCQEAISVAYALLQRHPGVFLGKQFDENDDDDDDVGDVGDVSRSPRGSPRGSPRCLRAASSLIVSLYRALQGSALSREAAVSAGVTVAAAVGAGVADPKRHAAALADAFAGRGGSASRPLLPPRTPGVARTASRRRRWRRSRWRRRRATRARK